MSLHVPAPAISRPALAVTVCTNERLSRAHRKGIIYAGETYDPNLHGLTVRVHARSLGKAAIYVPKGSLHSPGDPIYHLPRIREREIATDPFFVSLLPNFVSV